jgi:hypothetical protein
MIIILKTSSLEAQNYVRFVLPTSEEGGFGRNQPSWFPLFWNHSALADCYRDFRDLNQPTSNLKFSLYIKTITTYSTSNESFFCGCI